MRSDLLDRLNKWIAENASSKTTVVFGDDLKKVYEIRSIVGEIMRSINDLQTGHA